MQQGLTSEAYFAEQFFTDLARSTAKRRRTK
jgi:hypothetical protein